MLTAKVINYTVWEVNRNNDAFPRQYKTFLYNVKEVPVASWREAFKQCILKMAEQSQPRNTYYYYQQPFYYSTYDTTTTNTSWF